MPSSGSPVILLLTVATALVLLLPAPSIEVALPSGSSPTTTMMLDTVVAVASSSPSSSFSGSPSHCSSSLSHLFPPSGLLTEGVAVAGLVLPPPPRPGSFSSPLSPSLCFELELKSYGGVVQDSKKVCLGGGSSLEPAPYLLYSSSFDASAVSGLPGACPAALMLKATTTKKGRPSSPKLSWARALAPSGSAALLDVDWVRAEEEQKSPSLLVAALAAAFVAGVAVATTLLLLLRGGAPSQAHSVDDDQHDEEQQQQQRKAKPSWAREGGGSGRLRKVSTAAAGGGDGGSGGGGGGGAAG